MYVIHKQFFIFGRLKFRKVTENPVDRAKFRIPEPSSWSGGGGSWEMGDKRGRKVVFIENTHCVRLSDTYFT